MAGNNSVQILRGSRSAIVQSDQKLLDGQLLYNITDNYLTVGGGASNDLTKLPIVCREIKGYAEDSKNISSANTTEYSIKYADGNISFKTPQSIVLDVTDDLDPTDAGDYLNQATGKFSIVAGKSNIDTGKRNLIVGKLITNSGSNNVLGGLGNTVETTNSIVIGSGNTIKTKAYRSINAGYTNENSGSDSIQGGQENNNSGNRSIQSGVGNTNEATNSVQSGDRNTNTGNASFQTGIWNTNSSSFSVQVGNRNNNSGTDVIQAGKNNKNTASRVFQTGENNINKGQYSVQWGLNNKNDYKNVTTFGQYNDNKSTTLLEIGNGTSDTDRKNAFEVLRDGGFHSYGDASIHGSLIITEDNYGGPVGLYMNGGTIEVNGTAYIGYYGGRISLYDGYTKLFVRDELKDSESELVMSGNGITINSTANILANKLEVAKPPETDNDVLRWQEKVELETEINKTDTFINTFINNIFTETDNVCFTESDDYGTGLWFNSAGVFRVKAKYTYGSQSGTDILVFSVSETFNKSQNNTKYEIKIIKQGNKVIATSDRQGSGNYIVDRMQWIYLYIGIGGLTTTVSNWEYEELNLADL